ncbi:MAG TPA: cytochrome c, partial [Gemmatimonadaceae bacterium]|nr:cytochrome c [Gemmatimonadaceae bacterium]
DVLAADDDKATTVAPIYEMDVDLRRITEETYRKRGGTGQKLPGFAVVAGGRVDMRFAQDNDGELYILTKSDGMIRKLVGARVATTTAVATNTPSSVAAGKRLYDTNCASCHGSRAQGAVKAGIRISIIEEQRGKQPPDLTDDQWDHGSSDADIFRVIKRGLPPSMMAGFDGRIPDRQIQEIVNYLRSLNTPRVH